MPKYNNSTSAVITYQGLRVEPGETVETIQVLTGSLPTGLTQTDENPKYNPVKYSARLTGDSGNSGSINMPAGDQLLMQVFCSAGAIKVEFNDNITSQEVVVAGEGKKYQFLARLANTFKIYYLVTGTVADISIA